MLYYDKIDLGEGIDLTKNKNSKESIVCHHFNHGLKFEILFVMVAIIC